MHTTGTSNRNTLALADSENLSFLPGDLPFCELLLLSLHLLWTEETESLTDLLRGPTSEMRNPICSEDTTVADGLV